MYNSLLYLCTFQRCSLYIYPLHHEFEEGITYIYIWSYGPHISTSTVLFITAVNFIVTRNVTFKHMDMLPKQQECLFL
jgi:hypothetical protein